MPSPKPVTLTQAATASGPQAPEPLVVIGGLAGASTAGLVKRGVAVTNATVAADGTSAGTQLNALLVSLRNAGVIA